MWYQWFIFGIIFVLMPFGVANLKRIVFKKWNYTEEQNKQANIKVFIYTLFYWLCDLFYMSFLIDSLMWKFIFGGLIMVIIFYNLSNAFVNGNHTFKLGLLQDFLVGIGLSVYLIYIIPNKDLRNVIIPIIAGVYGGLLTLVGVAWTIRRQDELSKEEDRRRHIPYLQVFKETYTDYITLDNKWESQKWDNNVSAQEINNDKESKNYQYFLKPVIVKNISNSLLVFNSIFIDGKQCFFEGDIILNKDNTAKLDFQKIYIGGNESKPKILLFVKDILGFEYYLPCEIICPLSGNNNSLHRISEDVDIKQIEMPILKSDFTKNKKTGETKND